MKFGLYPDIPNSEYHQSTAICSTDLKKYIESPRKYLAYKIGELPFSQTPAMVLGSAVHSLVLEPDNFSNDFAVSQKFDCRTNAGKAAKAAFEAENNGKTIIDADVYETAQRIRDAIAGHPEVRLIMSEGKAELSGFYEDPDTGSMCRYRPDWRNDFLIADIKTCQSASKDGFKNQIAKLGYHISAAHYIVGDNVLEKTDHRQFVFIAAETEPPFLVATYVLSEKSLQEGERLRAKALAELSISIEHEHWPSYNNYITTEIDLPNYCFYNHDGEF